MWGGGEIKFSNPHIYRHEGVPNNPKVIVAIEKWAEAQGEIYVTMKDTGLYDENEPGHKEAMQKLGQTQDELLAVLPSANFDLIGQIRFDGGYVHTSF